MISDLHGGMNCNMSTRKGGKSNYANHHDIYFFHAFNFRLIISVSKFNNVPYCKISGKKKKKKKKR